MIDEEIGKIANILVNYSLQIRKHDLFQIVGNHLSAPLIREVYKQGLKAGAHPYVLIEIDDLKGLFFKHSSTKQLQYVSPIDKFEMECITAKLYIISPENTRNLSGVDPVKQAVASAARRAIMERFWTRSLKKEFRWCETQYPTQAAAQDAEMSLADYETFVFNAAHVNAKDPLAYWNSVEREQEKLRRFLEAKKKIHVLAKDTDLTISVSDRKWINCAGRQNFPDGEVATGPIENSAEGYIRFSFPSMYRSREIEDVRLQFKKGVVIKATALKGESFLQEMLKVDAGARRLGEFSFGTNYGIKQYTRNMLFDEKIGGTIHLAVGHGIPQTGSKNKSSIHWDMVCDLRRYGEIYADNQLIYKNGKFLSCF